MSTNRITGTTESFILGNKTGTEQQRGPIHVPLPRAARDALRARQASKAAEQLEQQNRRQAAARQAQRVAERQADLRAQREARSEGQRAAQQRQDTAAMARQMDRELGPAAPPTPTTVVLTLTPDRLACPSCGIAVHDVPGVTGQHTVQRVIEGRNEREVTYLRCPPCQERHDAAVATIEAHPSIAGRLGGSAAVTALSGALDALQAVGQHAPNLADRSEVSSLIARLAPLGPSARWSDDPASYGSTSTISRWAHVSKDRQHAVRQAAAGLLADRLDRAAPPVRVGPPQDHEEGISAAYGHACGFCGVGTVSVPAARVRALGGRTGASSTLWTRRTLHLAPLGGRADRQAEVEPVLAWLCPPCERRAAEHRGATVSALEGALADHLAALGDTATATDLRRGRSRRLKSYAAYVQQQLDKRHHAPDANREPWQHLANSRKTIVTTDPIDPTNIDSTIDIEAS